MKIVVKVKTRAKETSVVRETPSDLGLFPRETLPVYKVSVKAMPIGGQANSEVIRALAEYFSVPVSSVVLLNGASSKQKIFEIK